MSNFWDDLMGTDEGAASYMYSYGEGPGSDTRMFLSGFINPGESVLDVGCGPGWNFDHFKEFGVGVKYKGLDYSERFVKVANARAKERFGEEPFALGDVRNIAEKDNSWDVVIFQDVLEHTNGYKKPIEEALRVARKRVIVSFWKPFRTEGDGDQINDDGKDGYGSNYERGPWEQFLNQQGYFWTNDKLPDGANRPHEFYVIDKEEHGL